MKFDNIDPRLLKYHLTFNTLHIPFLALTQLFVAYYRSYISGVLSYRLGIPRSFVILLKLFLESLLFFGFSVAGKKSFSINAKAIPFIIVTGMLQVSLSQQIFVRTQILNGPFITA